jgi:hypothetical protein
MLRIMREAGERLSVREMSLRALSAVDIEVPDPLTMNRMWRRTSSKTTPSEIAGRCEHASEVKA